MERLQRDQYLMRTTFGFLIGGVLLLAAIAVLLDEESTLFVLLPILLGVFIGTLHLRVEATYQILRVGLRPLHTRSIERSEIVHVQAVTYRPIRHYGGWGIKPLLVGGAGGKGIAYSTHGNRGVRVELASGKHVLIGSLDPEALAAKIHATMDVPVRDPEPTT